MSDRIQCLPPPLSILCCLDDRRHDHRGDENALICTVHDNTLTAWMTVRRWWTAATNLFGGR